MIMLFVMVMEEGIDLVPTNKVEMENGLYCNINVILYNFVTFINFIYISDIPILRFEIGTEGKIICKKRLEYC